MKYISNTALIIIFLSFTAIAQMSAVPVKPQATPPAQKPVQAQETKPPVVAMPPKPIPTPEDNTLWYLSLAVLGFSLVGAVLWWMKDKNSQKEINKEIINQANIKANKEDGSVDGDKELEWLRKNQELIDKRRKRSSLSKKSNGNQLPNSKVITENQEEIASVVMNNHEKGVQLACRKDLPIYAILGVEKPNDFEVLSLSRDEALLGAIEQVHDEFEEDESVRELAVRILAMFKNRNAVEALSQVALYDLSSTLRVKALITLSEFDHESVFETILLACADPTREVRAAAARALTRLTFNRADAWTRIAECVDKWQIKQAADATIESGFVERSFERLIHNDYKQVYEAFTLLNLLIKADKIGLIIERLEGAKSMDVKVAILHVLKVTEARNSLSYLYHLYSKKGLPQVYGDALDEVIHRLGVAETV